MLAPYRHVLGPIEIDGDYAEQTLTIFLENGKVAIYRFSVSRQSEGPLRGCWMIDGVNPLVAE